MQEETKTEGTTTINQYPNNGWGNGYGWGGFGAPFGYAVPAYPAYGYGNGFAGGLDGLMRGFGGNINFGGGGKALGTVGTVLGAVALGGQLLQGGWRGFGPGGPGPREDFVTQRELNLVRENGALQGENGQLKAQIYTDNKIDGVVKTLVEWRQRQELIDTQTAAEVATLKNENANLKATLAQMTGTIISPAAFGPAQAVYTAMKPAAASAATGG